MSDEAYKAARRSIINNALRRQQKSLDLSRKKLTRLPPEIGQLTALESLYLRGNELSELPPEIGQLKNLRYLSLGRNRISILPHEFQNLTSLRFLDLSANQIAEFPWVISKLLRLSSLDINNNSLTGILASISELHSLDSLDLDNNSIRRLPREIGELRMLRTLSVANNMLAEIPSEIGKLKALRYLDLTNNQLTFLPAEMANLIALETLELEGNLLPDPFPKMDSTTVISYLRARQLQQEAQFNGEVDKLNEADHLRKLAITLEQSPNGAKFEPSDEHLIISPSGDVSDRDAAANPTTGQLHSLVRLKASTLANGAMRLANIPGWQALPGACERFRKIMDNDLAIIADRIGLAWAELVSLGSFLEQDSEIRGKPDAIVEPLPPDVRRSLADLVQTAGPWLRRFPTALNLDNEHASFQAPADKIPPAQKILKLAKDGKIIRHSDAVVIDSALSAGQHPGILSHKAGGFGVFSVRNVAVGAAALVAAHLAQGYLEYIGSEVAKNSTLAEKSIKFLHNGEDELARFLEDLPADIRAAVRTLIEEIRKLPGSKSPNDQINSI